MQENISLKIINFGPITSGFSENEGYMDFSMITVLCGTQGTGKSTIAKLYSTFVWLEKALVRGDVTVKYIKQYRRFVNKYLAFQNIGEYIKPDTFLHYKGLCYDFVYKNEQLEIVEHLDMVGYKRPQIMYFPAERNLLSVLDNTANVKGMPQALQAMAEEYRMACKALGADLELPVNGVRFHYDALNQMGSIVAPGYKVRLSDSSSGFQSVSPLYTTLSHLHELVVQKKNAGKSTASQKELELIDKRIRELLLDDTLSDETRSMLVKKVSDNRNERLISVIEEPEQNLFPDSQENLLYNLIRLSGSGENQLVMTTHSPYMLNYLSLAIKAYNVSQVVKDTDGLDRLNMVVPQTAWTDGDVVVVYQLHLDGTIHKLDSYDKMPSDDNLLNQLMMDANMRFSKLLEIEG